MSAKAGIKQFKDAAGQMRRLAYFLDRIRQPVAARNYEGFETELEAGVAQARLVEICAITLPSFRGGMGSWSDIYVMKADGSPDPGADEEFAALRAALSRFGERSICRTRFAKILPGLRWREVDSIASTRRPRAPVDFDSKS
jgi:hypothetical protein